MTTLTLADSYLRTDAGKTEIRSRTRSLSRPARNLLLVIDGSCNGSEWVAKVHGSTVDDLLRLIEEGLVEPSWRTAAPGASSYIQRVSVQTAVRDWSYDALYALLTNEARERFGLIKGLRMVLKIEGCADLQRLQETALEFVEQIRKGHGEESAARFRKQLGATE